MKLSAGLALLLGVVGIFGRSIIELRDGLTHNPADDGARLVKRAGRNKCDLSTFSSLIQERDLYPNEYDHVNDTLFRRVMRLPGPGQSEADFVIAETESPDRNTLAWQNSVTGHDVNTAAFRVLGNTAFSYNLIGLSGCTGMVLVSKRAVYFGHYWENVGFSIDPAWEDTYPTQEIAFDQTIRVGLQQGIDNRGVREQASLLANAALLDDDSLHGFLMIPRVGFGPEKDPEGNPIEMDDAYRAAWDRMKAIVHQILPRLDPADQSKWTEYRYDATDETRTLFTTVRGRLLFKYDPDHHGQKKTLLYLEDQRQDEGSWEWV